MDGNSWRDKIEKTLDAIHCSVVKIENEHGAKLEALFEGHAKLEQGQTRLEQGQAKIQIEIREINQTLGLLRPIANDHESRIQALETCPK